MEVMAEAAGFAGGGKQPQRDTYRAIGVRVAVAHDSLLCCGSAMRQILKGYTPCAARFSKMRKTVRKACGFRRTDQGKYTTGIRMDKRLIATHAGRFLSVNPCRNSEFSGVTEGRLVLIF